MNDGDGSKECKGQGNRRNESQPSLVAVSLGTTLQNHLRVPSLAVHAHTGVTLIDSGIPQSVTLANSQHQTSAQTFTQSHPQLQPQMQKLPGTQDDSQTQSDAQTNIHSLPQLQAQSQVLIQPQLETQPQVHSQQHVHTQSVTHTLPHIHIQSQLPHGQAHLQPQQPALQSPVMYAIAELMDHIPIQQGAKSGDEMSTLRVPVTRSTQNTNAVTIQDLQSSLDLSEIQSSQSQAKLFSALTSLSESNQINLSALGIHQGNMPLSQVLTQAQILDALVTDKVLTASKNRLGPSALTPVSSVCTSVLDSESALVTHDKPSTHHDSLVEAQLLHSQITDTHSHSEIAKLDSSDASNISSLISSNKLLNSLLDSSKPHVPSHIAKAAELAHLIPNPSVRIANALRAGELENGNLDIALSTSSRDAVPLTTVTRSCGTSVCTPTGALRNSSGYGDNMVKVSSSSQIENVSLPANLQLSSSSLLLSTLAGQNQVPHPKSYDALQQVLMGAQNTTSMEEPQLDALNNESLRLFHTVSPPQGLPATSCIVSGISTSAVSSGDKSAKKIIPTSVSQTNNLKCSLGLISNVENHSRTQTSVCTKQSLITSTDPMLATVATSANSPTSLNSYGLSKSVMSPQDTLPRVKSHITDSRVTQLALADLINRTSSSDIMLGGGNGNLLLGMTDTRISHTGDVLLSELHRSDESDLSLSSTLTGTGDDLHSNANTLVAEAALGTGIGSDAAPLHGLPSSPPLQGLPSPPLPSFSLPNITSDFMVSGISGSKLSSVQGSFPALLSNLATTSDFDQFLENSNMCIDMNSLSESEVSLSTAPSSFPYSPEKPVNVKKSSSPSSDLTFTNALKAANLKIDNELKEQSDADHQFRNLHHSESRSTRHVSSLTSSSGDTHGSITQISQSAPTVQESTPHCKTKDEQALKKPLSGQKEKRKEIFRRNELLVQQVACFKCRLCSFLSQDKGEMVKHMKQLHSEYLSDSEESETEVTPSPKKVKVHVPKKETSAETSNLEEQSSHKTKQKSKNRKQGKKVECKVENFNSDSDTSLKNVIKEEHISGRVEIFITTDQESSFSSIKDCKEELKDITVDPESDQEIDEDTNDSSATSDGGSVKAKAMHTKAGSSMVAKSSGTSKVKKNNPEVKASEKVGGIKCNLSGCGLKMKCESNMEYHRKCHEGGKFQCRECGEKFAMWCNLALHLWRQHMIDMELHTCDKCHYKSYSYSKLMNIHYKIHSDERPSLCDICGKRFKTPKQLRSHKAVHMRKMNSPPLRCEKCQRPFSDKRMLRNHMESVHNKVKPFLCNYCGYSTASKSTLKMHMRQHTGEKPFACEMCSYRTSDHNSLRRHKMQHSGVRPYRCPYCDYASIQATTFKVHLRDKHPSLAQVDGIVFTCGVCKFGTIKKDNYLAHVAEHGRTENKKIKQAATVTTSSSKLPQGTIISSTPVPHVVNIDVESGAVTVESPHDSTFLNAVSVHDSLQTQVPGQVTVAGDQYIYAAVDSSVLSRVRSGEGVMRITPDVVAIPMAVSADNGGSPPIQGLVYVATSSSQGVD